MTTKVVKVNKMSDDSILYKKAVGLYSDFISSEIGKETIENMTVYRIKDGSPEPVEVDEWCPFIYRILMRRYRNWQIFFENIDEFLDCLWEKLEILVPNFFLRYDRYQSFLKLTDEQLLDNGYSIQSFVDHTDDEVDNPLKDVIKTVTTQSASRTWSGTPDRLRYSIYNSNLKLVDEFLNQFKKLFIRLGATTEYFGR